MLTLTIHSSNAGISFHRRITYAPVATHIIAGAITNMKIPKTIGSVLATQPGGGFSLLRASTVKPIAIRQHPMHAMSAQPGSSGSFCFPSFSGISSGVTDLPPVFVSLTTSDYHNVWQKSSNRYMNAVMTR